MTLLHNKRSTSVRDEKRRLAGLKQHIDCGYSLQGFRLLKSSTAKAHARGHISPLDRFPRWGYPDWPSSLKQRPHSSGRSNAVFCFRIPQAHAPCFGPTPCCAILAKTCTSKLIQHRVRSLTRARLFGPHRC